MIICEYSELVKYQAILPMLEHALRCVEELRKQGFPTGRYEFEGGFLMVQRGSTKPYAADAFETHRKYIDVQYMIQGSEIAYYMPLADLKMNKAYNPEGDIAFFTKSGGMESKIQVREGMSWVAFPEDGHMPCRCEGSASEYAKIVMKLPCA